MEGEGEGEGEARDGDGGSVVCGPEAGDVGRCGEVGAAVHARVGIDV
jgi:hypothetical protein